MTKIPAKLENSKRMCEVTAVFYVDGKEYVTITQQVPEHAVAHVIGAAYVQIEEPDLEAEQG